MKRKSECVRTCLKSSFARSRNRTVMLMVMLLSGSSRATDLLTLSFSGFATCWGFFSSTGHCPFRLWRAGLGATSATVHPARKTHLLRRVPEFIAQVTTRSLVKSRYGDTTVTVLVTRATHGLRANVFPKKRIDGGLGRACCDLDSCRFAAGLK